MRNKCKIVALGFVVSCALVVYVLCVPSVGSVGKEKNLDRVGALEARVSALETEVARITKLLDQIITKPQPLTSVATKPAIPDKTKEIQDEADKQINAAKRSYQTAKKDRERLEGLGMSRTFDRVRREWIPSPEYNAAVKAEETAYKRMLEMQDRYKKTLPTQPSK